MKRCLIPYLSLTLCFFTIAQSQARRLVNRTVVTINDDVILESQIQRFKKRVASKSFQDLFGGIDPQVLKNRRALVQLLVEEKIIDQQVKKLGLNATDQEIDGQIRAITRRNGITPDQLRMRLSALGTNMEEYRAGIKRQVERRALVNREIKPNLEVSEEKLKYFFLRNAKSNDLQNEYQIAHVLISQTAGSPISAEKRANEIWKEMSKNPEKFAKFAKDFSDDSDTAPKGGVLGFYSLSELNSKFRKVVPKTPTGGITKPVRTAAGFHILKVLQVRKSSFENLSKAKKEQYRAAYSTKLVEERMVMWLARKKRESTIKIFD